MQHNRKRNQSLCIRLTADEKAILQKRAKLYGLSVTNFILLCAVQMDTDFSRSTKQALARII